MIKKAEYYLPKNAIQSRYRKKEKKYATKNPGEEGRGGGVL